MSNGEYSYPRISDEDYRKAVTQFRLQIGGILGILRMYGQGDYVDGVIPAIVELAEQFGMRVRGKPNQAIYVEPPYRADD
uniref:Uncharacterized protein n=1 Tax=viral metagenome TaxID=1070528 RepID=A0A6M3LMN6_9ZZZZ